jgi:hypothetical protein
MFSPKMHTQSVKPWEWWGGAWCNDSHTTTQVLSTNHLSLYMLVIYTTDNTDKLATSRRKIGRCSDSVVQW